MAKTATAAETAELARGYRKTRRGYVVSDKMDKTIVVEVEDRVKHPLYGKVMRRSSKVKAHDEAGSAGIGDLQLLATLLLFRCDKRVEFFFRGKPVLLTTEEHAVVANFGDGDGEFFERALLE